MKAYLLVLPALAFTVAVTNAYAPGAPVPVPNTYLPPAPEPLPPAVVVPPQPLPPPQPNTAVPQTQPEEPTEIDIIEDESPGFQYQSGFEGFILPDVRVKTETAPSILPVIASIIGLIKLPKFLLALTPIFGNGLLLLGLIGVIGAGFCAFTPFCALTLFPFRSGGGGVKSVLENERVKPALGFIVNSIEKYREVMRNIETGADEYVARKAAAKNTAVSTQSGKRQR